ncbi:MAG: creatininase family protein [Lentisphaerae bacterium]|jgi:creatinine amidohydrolase|nr:creatininase family protein [Lentisphaerota bacterium]
MAEPRLGDTTVQYELMFGRQAMARIRAFPVGYLPIGCPERHGDHLPMGLDAIKAHRVCCRVAEALGGTVFPPHHYAGIHAMTEEQLRKYTGEWGNLYTDATAEAHLLDVVHQIARTGIRTLILYSGHYPGCQVEMLERIRQQARKDFGIRVVPFCESMIISGDHAGLTETSFLLAVAPELVDMTRIGPENFADHGWSEEKSPLKASRERGEADIALIIEWMRTQLAGEE